MSTSYFSDAEARRERLRIMKEQNRVETDAMRRRRRKAQIEQQKLQEAADRVISQIVSQSAAAPSGRYNDISTAKVENVPIPEANRYLPSRVKYDRKAVNAQKALDLLLQTI